MPAISLITDPSNTAADVGSTVTAVVDIGKGDLLYSYCDIGEAT